MIIRAANIERKDWMAALHEFVFAYHVTPHSSTNIPPADLMFQRHFVIPSNPRRRCNEETCVS